MKKKICIGLLLMSLAAYLFVWIPTNDIIERWYEQLHITQQDAPNVDELEPKIVLNAPTICEVGELVRIDLHDSTVVTTLLVVTIPGLQITEDFEIIEDGRRAMFSSREPGEYVVMVAGAKGDEPFLAYQRISVEGDTSANPKRPNLGRQVSQWVRRVKPYEKRRDHGKALADVFRTTADQADVNVDGMLEVTAHANSAVLASDFEKWKVFLDGLEDALDKLIEDDQLQSREQYRTVWYDIAKGIERGL